jgi:WD40 repeat protein
VDAARGAKLAEFHGHDRGAQRVVFSTDGRHVYTGGADGTIRQWDLTAPSEPREFGHRDFIPQIVFSPDGRTLALPGDYYQGRPHNSSSHILRLYRLDGTEPFRELNGHSDGLTCIAYRPDGAQIATGSADRTAILWDPKTGAIERTLGPHKGAVSALAYSGDNQVLATGSEDGRVRLWNARTGTLRRDCAGHAGAVTAVACSPRRPWVASSGVDQTVRLWQVDSGRQVGALKAPAGTAATGLAFSPDGNVLACGFADWTIRLYDATSERLAPVRVRPMRMATRFVSYEGQGHTGVEQRALVGLAFSPNGRRLVSAARRCPVQIWDVQSGEEALVLPDPSPEFSSAAFSPDGRSLAASYAESAIVWEAAPRNEDKAPTAEETDRAAMAWHQNRSDQAERAEDWFAVSFHEHCLRVREPGAAIHWYREAIGHLARGDAARYRRVCTEMLGQFGATDDPGVASTTIYTCAIDPHAGGNPGLLAKVGGRAAAAFSGNERAYGAALYRAGACDDAFRQFEFAAPHYRRRAWDWLFLTLIHHRRGDSARARESYEAALPLMGPQASFYDWKERVEVQTLREEAEQLLPISGR